MTFSSLSSQIKEPGFDPAPFDQALFKFVWCPFILGPVFAEEAII